MVQWLLSGVAGWKSNRIALGKGVAEKVLSGTEIFMRRGKRSAVQKEELTSRMLICSSPQEPRGSRALLAVIFRC